LILILFTYGGWNEMAYLAAEMERPEKNILRGLVIGACGVMGIYVLMNVAFLYALGLGGLASSQAVAVDAVSGVLSTLGQSVIGALICISALGAVSALIFTGSRIAYAIGQDYPLFAFLGQWHPESETPMRALVVQALLSSLMIIILGASWKRLFTLPPPSIASFSPVAWRSWFCGGKNPRWNVLIESSGIPGP
jgi:basic amino acid/polyamine antiporter, APA family